MVNIAQLLFYPAANHFVGEMSEVDGFEQIWLDSTDEGVVVHNPATGNRVSFVVTGEDKDAEGEITAWHLGSTTGTREDGRFTMTVFND